MHLNLQHTAILISHPKIIIRVYSYALDVFSSTEAGKRDILRSIVKGFRSTIEKPKSEDVVKVFL